MISLNSPVTLPVVQAAIARAWNWWTGELREMVPRSVRERLSVPRPVVFVYTDTNVAILCRVDADRKRRLATVDLKTDTPMLDDARRALASIERPRVVICLAESLLLRRMLELPKSAEPNLRSIVGLDLDRQTPFTAETALFDFAVREHLADVDRILVDIAVVKRETLAVALSLCGKLGATPERIAVADEGGDPTFDLIPQRTGPPRFDPRARPRVLAAAGIVALIALNFGLAVWRMDSRIDALSMELASARKEAQAADKLRAELARGDAAYKLLIEAQAHLGPLQTLDALTRAMPDDVWLFDFELQNGSGQIGGFAPSAANLIAKLDKAGGLSNPHFKAPVTRSGSMSEDRFEIGFDLASGQAR